MKHKEINDIFMAHCENGHLDKVISILNNNKMSMNLIKCAFINSFICSKKHIMEYLIDHCYKQNIKIYFDLDTFTYMCRISDNIHIPFNESIKYIIYLYRHNFNTINMNKPFIFKYITKLIHIIIINKNITLENNSNKFRYIVNNNIVLYPHLTQINLSNTYMISY